MIRDTSGGIEVDVQVIPRAGATALAGTRNNRLLIRLAAPPVEGAANAALIDFLSRVFDCPKRAIRIVAGEQSRAKRVSVQGITAADASRRCADWRSR